MEHNKEGQWNRKKGKGEKRKKGKLKPHLEKSSSNDKQSGYNHRSREKVSDVTTEPWINRLQPHGQEIDQSCRSAVASSEVCVRVCGAMRHDA